MDTIPQEHEEAITRLLEDGSLNYEQIASLFNTTAQAIQDFKYKLASIEAEKQQPVEEEPEEEEESGGLTTEDFANLMEHLGGVLTEVSNLIRKIGQ